MTKEQSRFRYSPSSAHIETELDRIEVIDVVMVEVFKKKSSLERLLIAFALWSSAKKQLFHNLRSLHPDWDEKKLNREVARRISHGTA